MGAKAVTVTTDSFEGLPPFLFDHPSVPIIKCPENLGKLTCNSCGLCDVQKRTKRTPQIVVVFRQHDITSHKRQQANAAKGVGQILGKVKAAGKALTKRLHKYISWFSG